jgi:hypothetical protein
MGATKKWTVPKVASLIPVHYLTLLRWCKKGIGPPCVVEPTGRVTLHDIPGLKKWLARYNVELPEG